MAPTSVSDRLAASVESATWLQDSDAAAVGLAVRLAVAFDQACDSGEIELASKLWRGLLSALEQLHLTPARRLQGKLEDINDGSNHIGAYLRLIDSAPSEPKPGTTNSRSGGQRSSRRTGNATDGVAKIRS